jgi:hypothetical protein
MAAVQLDEMNFVISSRKPRQENGVPPESPTYTVLDLAILFLKRFAS